MVKSNLLRDTDCIKLVATGSVIDLPVSRTIKPTRKSCVLIAVGCLELVLVQEQRSGEVGTGKLRAAQVSARHICAVQIGALQPSADHARAPQVRTAQVGTGQISLDQIGAMMIDGVPAKRSPRKLARPCEQVGDLAPVTAGVQPGELIGRRSGQRRSSLDLLPKLCVQRAGRRKLQRPQQVPQRLVQLAHDRERGKHAGRQMRCGSPVLPTEGDACDLLPGSKTVIHGAPAVPVRAQVAMDATATVVPQVGAGTTRRLRVAELRRRRE